MPSISSFNRNLIELYRNGRVINLGPTIELVKKTPFVETITRTKTLAHSGITSTIIDTFGRKFHKNTLSCNEGFWVYKINGNNHNVTTATLFNSDGIRMLKKVYDSAGTVVKKLIAYDKNGVNPKEVPATIMKLFI